MEGGRLKGGRLIELLLYFRINACFQGNCLPTPPQT